MAEVPFNELNLRERHKMCTSRVESFDRNLERMIPWLDPNRTDWVERLDKAYMRLAECRVSMRDIFIDFISDDNILHLNGAEIRFLDKKATWTMIGELLFNEEYALELDTERPFILDCGTNIGLAIYYYKHCWPQARVIGFEPWPVAYEAAQWNIEHNAWDNVIVYPYALADRLGTLTFHIPKDNSIAGTLTNRCYDDTKGEIMNVKVECRCLSEFLTEPVDFLKMDIEGSEKPVLFEAREGLEQVRNLFCEYHFSRELKDNALGDIVSLLESSGFTYAVNYTHSFQKRGMRPLQKIGMKLSMGIYARRISENADDTTDLLQNCE